MSKVDGKKNLADMLTKPVDAGTLRRFLKAMGLEITHQRSTAIPETQDEDAQGKAEAKVESKLPVPRLRPEPGRG